MQFLPLMLEHAALQLRYLGLPAHPYQQQLAAGFCDAARRSLQVSVGVLTALRQRFTLGVISNFYGNVATLCQECGLAALCDVIIDSAQVGVSKPEQRIFTLALEQLGRAPHTAAYMGDSFERDVLGARAAGLAYHLAARPRATRLSGSVDGRCHHHDAGGAASHSGCDPTTARTACAMKVGILAAGDRLPPACRWSPLPKPLLPIAGVPLIGRLLRALQPLTPEAIVCIINNQGSSVADYVRQHYPALPIEFVQQDTASSYESFTVLCAHLHGSPFLVTTVDSVFPPDFLPQFVAAADQQPGMDMMLAVTTFIDDEKPLHVRLTRTSVLFSLVKPPVTVPMSPQASTTVHHVSVQPAPALAPTRVSALREFLGWLQQHGYWLQGYLAPKTIDVDRPQDIAVAEQFVQEFEHPIGPSVPSPCDCVGRGRPA